MDAKGKFAIGHKNAYLNEKQQTSQEEEEAKNVIKKREGEREIVQKRTRKPAGLDWAKKRRANKICH